MKNLFAILTALTMTFSMIGCGETGTDTVADPAPGGTPTVEPEADTPEDGMDHDHAETPAETPDAAPEETPAETPDAAPEETPAATPAETE